MPHKTRHLPAGSTSEVEIQGCKARLRNLSGQDLEAEIELVAFFPPVVEITLKGAVSAVSALRLPPQVPEVRGSDEAD